MINPCLFSYKRNDILVILYDILVILFFTQIQNK